MPSQGKTSEEGLKPEAGWEARLGEHFPDRPRLLCFASLMRACTEARAREGKGVTRDAAAGKAAPAPADSRQHPEGLHSSHGTRHTKQHTSGSGSGSKEWHEMTHTRTASHPAHRILIPKKAQTTSAQQDLYTCIVLLPCSSRGS